MLILVGFRWLLDCCLQGMYQATIDLYYKAGCEYGYVLTLDVPKALIWVWVNLEPVIVSLKTWSTPNPNPPPTCYQFVLALESFALYVCVGLCVSVCLCHCVCVSMSGCLCQCVCVDLCVWKKKLCIDGSWSLYWGVSLHIDCRRNMAFCADKPHSFLLNSNLLLWISFSKALI